MKRILALVKVLVEAVMPTAAIVFPKAFVMGAAMLRSTYAIYTNYQLDTAGIVLKRP